jgi:hypothetical protein
MKYAAALGALILSLGCSTSSKGEASDQEVHVEFLRNPLDCTYCLGMGNMGDPISTCGWCRGTGLKSEILALAKPPPPVRKSSGRVVER